VSTGPETLATVIRRLHLHIRSRAYADVQRAGFDDVAPAHLYVFQTPGPDGARPTELAARTLMTKQAMHHLLAGLEERGYIERVHAEADRRGRVLRLTERGRALTAVMQESARRIELEWAEEFGRKAIEGLRGTLGSLDARQSAQLNS
jgi:DNA-binding MarR family transcriptional regulator